MPKAGTEVEPGSIIYVQVSLGKEPQATGKMPLLTGQDLNYDAAKQLLATYGFYNIKQELVSGEEKFGTVIGQSEQAHADVDLSKQIILYASDGQKLPEKPVDPEIPEDPVNPEDPEIPEEPENPEIPEEPEVPEIPEDPDVPTQPSEPEIPEDSENPEIPEDPAI